MVRAFALLSSVVALALTAPACGPDTCGGQSRSADAAAPEITAFYVLSEDKQIPGDPWTVLFGLEFADSAGDLGTGRADFYLNSNPEPSTHQLNDLFRQNALVHNATEGAFWLTLRFAESTVDDGTRVRLGAQLVDAAELRSNCYTLDLEFDVYPAASLERAAPAWRIASTRCGGEGRS